MKTFAIFLCLAVLVGFASARKTAHGRRDAARPCNTSRLNADGTVEQCKRSCRAKYTPSTGFFAATTPTAAAALASESSISPSSLSRSTVSAFTEVASATNVTATATEAAVITSTATPPSSTEAYIAPTTSTKVAPTALQAVIASSATTPAASEPSSSLSGDAAKFVDMHNVVRAQYGSQPVEWSSELADYAQAYAFKCLKVHSHGPYGENLATSVGFSDSIAKGINGWAGEASLYDWNNPTFGSGTGHFTQLVWKGTTQIGCAHIECPSGTLFNGIDGTNDNVVCEYFPAGNMQGAFAENVGTAI